MTPVVPTEGWTLFNGWISDTESHLPSLLCSGKRSARSHGHEVTGQRRGTAESLPGFSGAGLEIRNDLGTSQRTRSERWLPTVDPIALIPGIRVARAVDELRNVMDHDSVDQVSTGLPRSTRYCSQLPDCGRVTSQMKTLQR